MRISKLLVNDMKWVSYWPVLKKSQRCQIIFTVSTTTTANTHAHELNMDTQAENGTDIAQWKCKVICTSRCENCPKVSTCIAIHQKLIRVRRLFLLPTSGHNIRLLQNSKANIYSTSAKLIECNGNQTKESGQYDTSFLAKQRSKLTADFKPDLFCMTIRKYN